MAQYGGYPAWAVRGQNMGNRHVWAIGGFASDIVWDMDIGSREIADSLLDEVLNCYVFKQFLNFLFKINFTQPPNQTSNKAMPHGNTLSQGLAQTSI